MNGRRLKKEENDVYLETILIRSHESLAFQLNFLFTAKLKEELTLETTTPCANLHLITLLIYHIPEITEIWYKNKCQN